MSDHSPSSDSEPSRRPEGFAFINRETLVPIGLLVAVVISSISATVWINTRLLNLENSVASIAEKLKDLKEQVADHTGDRWTTTDMAHWIELANASNPAIKLPAIRPSR